MAHRILFWSGTFWPHIGGVETLAMKYLPAMRERGYEFLVVTPKRDPRHPDDDRFGDIPVLRFALWNSIDELAALRSRLTEAVDAFAPDLVHINAVGISNFLCQRIASARRVPSLVTLHGKWSLFQGDRNSVVERTLSAATHVAGCCQAIVRFGCDLVPEIEARSSVIYNGMDAPDVMPQPLPVDAPRLLCLGRLSPEKGFDIALEAFSIVRRVYPLATLLVAGDGPAARELQQQAEDLGIEGSVRFLGSVDPSRVPSVINQANLVLMPSREESLSMVALESGLMERPVIAARVGGLPEVVIDDDTGLLVEEENPTQLAAAVVQLFEHPQWMARIGRAARRRAQQKFGFRRHVDSYDSLYQRMLRDPSHGTTGSLVNRV